MDIIPAIDLRNGRCVRLLEGRFDRETRYSDDPPAVAAAWRKLGFDRLHVVDLDGARSGEQRHAALVTRLVAESGMAVQLGGGIRNRVRLGEWLQAGVARCVIGSLAVSQRDVVAGWLRELGPEVLVLAIDVRTGGQAPVPAIHGWTENAGTTLWECLDFYRRHGLRHLLCTDVGRDGALSGPNLDLYGEIRARFPELALQASGGVRDIEDLEALRDLGCSAAITGRALLDARIEPKEVKPFLRGA